MLSGNFIGNLPLQSLRHQSTGSMVSSAVTGKLLHERDRLTGLHRKIREKTLHRVGVTTSPCVARSRPRSRDLDWYQRQYEIVILSNVVIVTGLQCCIHGRQYTAAQPDLSVAANLEGALVWEDKSSTKGFQSLCALCEATCGLFAFPHNGHTTKLQQMAQLDDELAHCAVGRVQDDTIPWLQATHSKLSRMRLTPSSSTMCRLTTT